MKTRALACFFLAAPPVWAQATDRVVLAAPERPVHVLHPGGVPRQEAQVVLAVVVNTEGRVESAIATSTLPADLPPEYVDLAVAAVRATPFSPSLRDGRPVRSRVEYIVVFPPPERKPGPRPADEPEKAMEPATPAEPIEVEVRGQWLSPRGVGDMTLNRELLEASPRQFTSELLSAAPGFFVDHENSEGFGNDIYLRGFDLSHGSGIELGVGNIPVNQPVHIQGPGYVDANFIIPEVVDSLHVLEGPYDPRQGDASIVGSAFFNLGVADRGYRLGGSYGSFGQARGVGIVAPHGASKETFAAFAVRKTDGFGARGASQSATANAQLGLDLGQRDHLRLLGVAYGARTELPGVVRQDHVEAGLIDFYGTYPHFSEGQAAQSSRILVSGEWQHQVPEGGRFDLSLWTMWTNFSSRQNFTGAFESSQIDPNFAGLGDLFERTNEELAAGLRSSYASAPFVLSERARAVVEPGVVVRVGDTDMTRSLLVPTTLEAWDRRTDAGIGTLDVGAYLDVDLHLFDRLRIAGGPRVDVLSVSVEDRLANVVPAGVAPDYALPGERRSATGVAGGPRLTLEYRIAGGLAVSTSYGEAFRSLDPLSLQDGTSRPYSKVRSVEVGLRGEDPRRRYLTTLAGYNTWVENELVFVPEAGGFETQERSIRRGIVGSFTAEPARWLLASTALSVTNAFFRTNVPNVGHQVASVPPLLYRADLTVRGTLARVATHPLTGRLGLGYTLLSPLHLTDDIRSPSSNILNAGGGLRYRAFELELDIFNVIGARYADDANYYLSNWAFDPGQQPASAATHLTAAPPRTFLGTLSVHL